MSNEYDPSREQSPVDSDVDRDASDGDTSREHQEPLIDDDSGVSALPRTPFADSTSADANEENGSNLLPQSESSSNDTPEETQGIDRETLHDDGIVVVAEHIADELPSSTDVSLVQANASEETNEPLIVEPLDRIRLLKSYYFICESKNWYLAVLGGFLCVLVSQAIPLVPFVVFGGYLLIVIESQLRSPGEPYPDFAFEKFTDYLTKAVWPFLVSLGFLAILTILYFTCYFGGIFGMIAASSVQDADTLGISLSIILPALALMWVIVIFGTIILSSAMMLRAGLTGSFVEAFRIRWLWDFCRRTWLEQLMAAAFFSIAYNLLTILGLFAFCIGAFAAQAVALMAHAQVVSQLYRIYLSRGGEPMPGHVLSR